MGFQTAVSTEYANGVVGEILYDGPTRAESFTLATGATTPNVVGRAYTNVLGVDGRAAAGAIGAGEFAGILSNPKVYSSQGSSSSSIAPTLDVADGSVGELLTMGEMIVYLSLVGTGVVGEALFYNDLTGELGSGVPAAGFTALSNAKISRKNVSTGAGPRLAVIRLTEAEND